MNSQKNTAFRSFNELRESLNAGVIKMLVVVAAHDPHTLEAVFTIAYEFQVKYLLVGNRGRIMAFSAELGYCPSADCIVDGKDDADCAGKAVALIRDGAGDVLVKGLLETAVLMKAVLNAETGIRGSGTLTHLAVVEVPGYHKLVTITDGGMLTFPSLEQKAEIVRCAVNFYHKSGFGRPKIAVICASESVSEKIPETVDAAKLQDMCVNGELGDCMLEGPISFDLAVSAESARVKGFKSAIAGDVDVLLFPNITAANALCKGLIYWAGAKMAGCVYGAKVPIVVVSRGASAEEKLLSIMLCLWAGEGGRLTVDS